jgi:hypothetical protein
MSASHDLLMIDVRLLVPGPVARWPQPGEIKASTGTPGHEVRNVNRVGGGLVDGEEYVRITLDLYQVHDEGGRAAFRK